MSERENDTLYLMLNEIVSNYSPKTKIPEHLLEWYVRNFMFEEEGDTGITGSFYEWMLFIGIIIDQFKENEKGV